MRKLFRNILPAVLTVVLLAGMVPAASAANITFSDIKGHWSEPFVYAGVDAGYINGHPDGTFRPDDTVTRGQFSKMINHALDISNTASISFGDVSHNAWYFNEVQKALASGYIAGYSDNTFRADREITRQEAAVMVARVISPPEVEYSISSLADSGDVASWAAPYVKTVFSKNYMVGDNNNNFLPDAPLTRGAAAKIITMVLDNENIISNSPTAAASGTTYNNTVFSNNLTIGSSVGDGSVSLGNCRVLGTLTANGGGSSSGVVLRDSAVNNLNMAKADGNLNLVAVGNTSVNTTTMSRPGHLEASSLTGSGFASVLLSGSGLDNGTVTLTGEFPAVDVHSNCVVKGGSSRIKLMRLRSRCNLVVQSGTIDELEIESNAKNATVQMNSGVKCSLANVHAPIRFTGDSKIGHAVEHCKDIYYATTPSKVTEYDDGTSKPVSGVDTLTPTISPTSGSTGIALDRTIRLTFSESIYRANGNSMTAGYLESSVIELRRGSATGTAVNFTAEISSSSKVVTITPDSNLAAGTKYFVIVLKDSITNSAGDTNAKSSFSFTTQTVHSLAPTVSPANNATKVSRTPSIVLTFDEAVYQSNGKDLTTSYFQKSVVLLREGSYDGVNHIICDVTLNSNKKVTLKPQTELKADTTYYLILKEDTLSSANVGSNDQFTSCFSTGSTVKGMITVSPDNGATAVAINVSPKLTFARALRAYNGGTLTDRIVQNGAIELRKGSKTGALVDFYADVSSDKKTITLSPDELAINTTYYIIIPANSLEYSDGEVLPKTEYSFKTGDNTAKFSKFAIDSKTASTAVVSMTTAMNGRVTLTATPPTGSSLQEVKVSNISVTSGVNKLVTISGLEPSTKYTVKGVFTPSNGSADVTTSTTVTTTAASMKLAVGEPDAETKTVQVTATVDAIGEYTLTYQVKGDDTTRSIVMNQYTPGSIGKIESELSGLEPGTTYVVNALYKVGTKELKESAEFTTEAPYVPSDNNALSLVRVQLVDGKTGYLTASTAEGSETAYRRSITKNEHDGVTKIRIEATAADSKATVKIGETAETAKTVSNLLSEEIKVEAGKTYNYVIVVTPESGADDQQIYTIEIIIEE